MSWSGGSLFTKSVWKGGTLYHLVSPPKHLNPPPPFMAWKQILGILHPIFFSILIAVYKWYFFKQSLNWLIIMRFNHWNGVQIRPNTFLDYAWIMSKSVSLSDPGLLIFLWQLPLSSSSVSSSLSHFKQWPFAFQLSRLSWCCFVGAFADSVPLKSCDATFYPIPKFRLC